MNDINSKINYIAEYFFNSNNSKFAEFMDSSEANIRNYRKNTIPKLDFIVKLCEKLEISFDWILSDEGNMLKKDKYNNIETSNIVQEPLHELQVVKSNRKTKDGIVPNQEVPLYDLEATAGLQQLFDSGSPRAILDTIKIPNLPKCDGAISITGDSMYPLLKSGDIVLYKQTNVDNIFFGEMYLLSVAMDEWEEYVMVKYVQKSDKGDEYVKLVSQNSHHQSKDIHVSKITALALVKASIRINNMF